MDTKEIEKHICGLLIGVRIDGCRRCMTSYGIKNVSSKTVIKKYFDAFKDDVCLQNLLGDRV